MKKLFLLALLPLFLTGCFFTDDSIKKPPVSVTIPENLETIDLIDEPETAVDDIPLIELETIVDMDSIELEIRELFVAKYNSTLANIEVNIDLYDAAGFARGMVVLDGGGPGNEGNFLAALDGGAWVLVFDGNGFWDCTETMSYGFPETMTPDCYQN